MVPLRFSDHAEIDLIEIGDFIATDSAVNARRFVADLEKYCLILAAHPLLGRARDDLLPGLRSLPYHRYLIFYRALHSGVEIVRVLHGARDIRRAFRRGRRRE
jgi:toxin ParE1/3/4